MTTKQDLETSLIGFVNSGYVTAFPTAPLVWGNAAFDYNSPPDVYTMGRVVIDHTEGLAVNSPKDRHFGSVQFTVVTKLGLGTFLSNQILEWLYRQYQHAVVDGIEVRSARQAGENAGALGWEAHLFVPFVSSPL